MQVWQYSLQWITIAKGPWTTGWSTCPHRQAPLGVSPVAGFLEHGAHRAGMSGLAAPLVLAGPPGRAGSLKKGPMLSLTCPVAAHPADCI